MSELEFELGVTDWVVHCHTARYDVYIGRPGPWGNPFTIGRDGSREDVIRRYRDWILGQPELLVRLEELRGKVLGCWCRPRACHGDVLVELLRGGSSMGRAAR